MSLAVITGSAGLIGSEASRFFARAGMKVVGVDNDLRKVFFGEEASTDWNRRRLEQELGAAYEHVSMDIRDGEGISRLLARFGRDISLRSIRRPNLRTTGRRGIRRWIFR